MKKWIYLFILIFTILFSNLIFAKFEAKAVISSNYIYGQLNSNMRLDYINESTQYLFVPTDNGMNLVDPETFSIVKQINLNSKIINYVIIDNIEDENKPYKDLILFLEDENMPSVIVYSLDSLNKIWSFTAYTTGYNEQSIKIEKKTPIFEYDIDQDNILLVSGYQLYNLNIKTGLENWHYEYQDNIWSVAFMGDVNNDQIDDIAISVQPTNVIGLNGENGQVLWESEIAKPYQVKIDNKVLGDIKTNIWDLQFLNNSLIATGEDGNIYKVAPKDGLITNEQNILDNIPNVLVYQVYLEGKKVKEFSGLSTSGMSTYKIINTRSITDSNDDNVNDLLVTVFESNKYSNFSSRIPIIYLIDGSTFKIIWDMEFNDKQLLDLIVYNNGDISFYDGKKVNSFNVKSNDNIKEILVNNPTGNENNNPNNSLNPLIFNDTLIVNYNSIYKLNIDDLLNPSIISTIAFFNGYDTITKNNNIYKLYYTFDKSIKNYHAIECFDPNNDLLWNYDLKDLYFNKYLIIDENDMFTFINNENKLITINVNDSTEINQYLLPDNEEISNRKVNVFSKTPDFNKDGKEDILINFDDGNFLILNTKNLNDIIISNNLNNLININEKYFNFIFPIFNENKKEMYVLSNDTVAVVSFDDNLEVKVEKEITLGNYNFWGDPQNIIDKQDFDKDGYNDIVLRLYSDSKNKALILFSNESVVGSIATNWDFSLYPTYEDLNNDGKYEIIMTTNGEDENGDWHTRSEIVNPYVDFNSSDILFVKKFYDGNELSYNSQMKPLTIIDDITGDGKKDVMVLVDRWGESYLQIYSIDDNKTVKKIIPLNIRYIEKSDMQNSNIGSPGGYVSTFNYEQDKYMILTIINQSVVTTKIMRLNNLDNMQNIVNINGRLHDFYLRENKFIYELFNKKYEDNYFTNTLQLDQFVNLLDFDKDKTYKEANILIKWEKVPNVGSYRIYVDEKLVEVTSLSEVNMLLSDGVNNIGIGEVFDNGIEQITYFTINADLDNHNYNYLIYTLLLLASVFILPMKIFKYRRRELYNE